MLRENPSSSIIIKECLSVHKEAEASCVNIFPSFIKRD